MNRYFKFQHLHASPEPLPVTLKKRHFTLKNPDALEKAVTVAKGPVGDSEKWCFYRKKCTIEINHFIKLDFDKSKKLKLPDMPT